MQNRCLNILWSVVAAVLFGASGCAGATSPETKDYRGAYATSRNIRDAGDIGPIEDLVQPSASGVFIRIAWSSIQPEQGRADWSLFDRIAVPAIKAGKKLSLGIIAGTYAPDWLGDRLGLKHADFRISQRGCWNARLYYPWDVRYQDAYLDMMRLLKAHLQSLGGSDNLKIVKISFIAQHTLELRLPRRPAGNYRGCTIDDSSAVWMRAGYTPDRVVSGYRRVVGIMARDIFPTQLLSQATQRGDAFPDIGNDGRPAPDGTADTPLVDAIVKACMVEAGRRCAIQNQSLQTVGPLGDRVLAARQQGAVIGWQTAMNRGRARCQREDQNASVRRAKRIPRVPCTMEGYEKVLSRAIDAGATYLELWPTDIAQFGPAVLSAERRMAETRT